MNRQEAIEQLKEWLARAALQGLIPGDVVAGELQKIVKAFSGPQPDPKTGLVPCGCGGKARLYELSDDFYLVRVECSQCYVATRATYNEERATHDWNTAMGWKGGAE